MYFSPEYHLLISGRVVLTGSLAEIQRRLIQLRFPLTAEVSDLRGRPVSMNGEATRYAQLNLQAAGLV